MLKTDSLAAVVCELFAGTLTFVHYAGTGHLKSRLREDIIFEVERSAAFEDDATARNWEPSKQTIVTDNAQLPRQTLSLFTNVASSAMHIAIRQTCVIPLPSARKALVTLER